ncbi:PhosphoLipase D-like protein [Phytophthora palmivora]|uniref:PhosphoLipase D-like protein n=1 Tax=Phytophthora palmivora TaxID=4796 RepID=A0A2P4XZ91_9STRA|nr:PhosphoLipase D-like protein [Phytophthora palmivora]
MTFIEAADEFKAAASTSNKASILQHLEVNYHAYYIAITDAVRKSDQSLVRTMWAIPISFFDHSHADYGTLRGC